MSVRDSITIDGRCFRCVQRKRYTEEVVAWGDGHPRHLLDSFGPLCEKPLVGRRPRQEKMRAYRAAWENRKRETDPAVFAWRLSFKRWRQQLWRYYSMTPAEHEALIVWQGGRCACCWREVASDVDHDHTTGRVRGVLCGLCNRMIGQAKEDPARLRAGIEYLERG